LNLAIRVDGDPASLAPSVRSAIWDLEKDAPITHIVTLEAEVSESTASQKFQAFLLGTFAGIALILAAIGLYGVLAFFVSQRTRELGIRMALGASNARVIAEVAGKGAALAGIGIGLGLVGGSVVARLLSSLLFDITPYDPVTYVSVAAFLTIVAIAACVLPARRASRIEPVTALKNE
jgi:ABC-type antimicrobial peptide transport system permease subunit